MAEYTNNHVETEDLPEGIHVDGIGDIHSEDGDNVNVPLMENGKPCPEDPEKHDNPDYPDAGTEDDDDPYGDWDDEADRDDDDAGAELDPRDRFYEFANISVGFFSSLSSILSNKDLQELSFGVSSGDFEAYFSIKTRS